MNIEDEIRSALKSNNAIIGYRESIKFIKMNSPKMIVLARNAPKKIKEEIAHNAELSKVKVEIFEGSSVELGTICGKPFPVMTLVIKD